MQEFTIQTLENFFKHLIHEGRLKSAAARTIGFVMSYFAIKGASQQVEHLHNAVEATARTQDGARLSVRLCVNVR